MYNRQSLNSHPQSGFVCMSAIISFIFLYLYRQSFPFISGEEMPDIKVSSPVFGAPASSNDFYDSLIVLEDDCGWKGVALGDEHLPHPQYIGECI